MLDDSRWTGNIQLSAAETMADSDDRTRHALALDVDEIQKVARMIEPAGCAGCQNHGASRYSRLSHTVIPQAVLVDHTALSLMCHICHPNTPDSEPAGFRPGV